MRFLFNPFTDKLDISSIGPGGTTTQFVTGNSGGPVPSDAAFNINILGDNTTGINTIGNLSPSTLTIFGLASSTTQVGTTRYATNAESAAQLLGTASLTPANITSLFSTNPLPSSQGGTGLSSPAANSLIVTNGSSAYTQLGVASNGQLPIGSIGSAPVLNTLTAGTGVTITNGPGTITVGLTGGGISIDSIGTQTGTNPITPTGAGLVTINGAVVAAGTNPVRSDGTGANTMAIEVQTSQAIAAADATKIGLCNFDSASFAVAATGFVTAAGTGILKTLTGDSGGAISPTAGNINTIGSGSITIAGSGSTLTTQLTGLTNHAVLVGAGTTTITKLGVGSNGQVLIGATAADPAFATLTSSDSSISFTTGTNSLSLQVASGTAVVKTLTGNSGGALSPTAGNISTVGTGSITIAGSGSTLTTQLTGLTNHAILVGAGTATISNVGPTATAGQIFQSAGSSADPVFSTATYPAIAGTSGKILISNGTNIVSSTPTYPNASVTAGKVIISDGTNYIASTPTFPNSATGTGKILRADGTNWVATTATYPDTAGTSGNVLTSDGTNWTSAAPSGGVTGPGSSTDRAIATWNGTGGTALFNNSTSIIDSSGRSTNTSQPIFQATPDAQANVTGDGTTYTVIWQNTSINIGSWINTTTGIATTPVAGNYLITGTLFLSGILITHTRLILQCAGVDLMRISPFVILDSNGDLEINFSTIASLGASATFQVDLTISNGTKVVDIGTISTFRAILLS